MSLSHFAPDLHLQGQLQQNRGGLEVRRGQKLVKRLTGSHVVRLQSHEFSGRENVGGKTAGAVPGHGFGGDRGVWVPPH